MMVYEYSTDIFTSFPLLIGGNTTRADQTFPLEGLWAIDTVIINSNYWSSLSDSHLVLILPSEMRHRGCLQAVQVCLPAVCFPNGLWLFFKCSPCSADTKSETSFISCHISLHSQSHILLGCKGFVSIKDQNPGFQPHCWSHSCCDGSSSV